MVRSPRFYLWHPRLRLTRFRRSLEDATVTYKRASIMSSASNMSKGKERSTEYVCCFSFFREKNAERVAGTCGFSPLNTT